jgi:hypothetical protein
MPKVAAERGLADPFNPVQALPESAEFLRELLQKFGNLGLAAAAYNAGARRISEWLSKKGKLPAETRHYVMTITGHAPERWARGTLDPVSAKLPARMPCRHLADFPMAQASAGAAPTVNAKLAAEVTARLAEPNLRATSPVRVRASIHVSERKNGAAQRPEVSEPEVSARRAPARTGAWGVQLASHWSESKALQGFDSLRHKHPSVLGNRKATIVQAKMAGNAVMKRVQIAMTTRADAEQLCSRLKTAGGACLVMKN